MNRLLKVNAIVTGVKAAMRQQKIKAAIEQKMAAKGQGRAILENLGKELSSSGGVYKDVKNPSEAASVLLSQLDRILSPDITKGNHSLVYKSDNLLLISIDNQYYEITGSDLKSSILKLARNAGVPSMFSGVTLAKSLIEGLIAFFKEKDPNYNKKNRLLE